MVIGITEKIQKNNPMMYGPGVVIGRDGSQVFVSHGGEYIRVHCCRLQNFHE